MNLEATLGANLPIRKVPMRDFANIEKKTTCLDVVGEILKITGGLSFYLFTPEQADLLLILQWEYEKIADPDLRDKLRKTFLFAIDNHY